LDDTLALWSRDPRRPSMLKPYDEQISGLAFGSDSTALLAVGTSGRIRKISLSDGSEQDLIALGTTATGCAQSGDGSILAVLGRERGARLFDPVTGELLGKVSATGTAGASVCSLANDGRTMVTGSVDDGPSDEQPLRDAFGRPIVMVEGFLARSPGDLDRLGVEDWTKLHTMLLRQLGRHIAQESTGGELQTAPAHRPFAARADRQ
jgi:hypothetical protein